MTDLTPEQVRSFAAALGLAITDDDLEDVTFRLNASLEHLVQLDALEPLSGSMPLPDAG